MFVNAKKTDGRCYFLNACPVIDGMFARIFVFLLRIRGIRLCKLPTTNEKHVKQSIDRPPRMQFARIFLVHEKVFEDDKTKRRHCTKPVHQNSLCSESKSRGFRQTRTFQQCTFSWRFDGIFRSFEKQKKRSHVQINKLRNGTRTHNDPAICFNRFSYAPDTVSRTVVSHFVWSQNYYYYYYFIT